MRCAVSLNAGMVDEFFSTLTFLNNSLTIGDPIQPFSVIRQLWPASAPIVARMFTLTCGTWMMRMMQTVCIL